MTTCLFLLVSSARGADWGGIKGRFVYDGDAGEPAALVVNKDVKTCGKCKLVDEGLVVGKGGGLANTFFYLYLKRGKTVDIHPDYDKDVDKPVVLDNVGCRFEPHALLLYAKHPLEIRNSDGIGHNTNATLLKNPTFNEMVPNDLPLVKKFEKSEPYPATFACNMHPWMNAHVLVRTNPYMAVSGTDGGFEIKNMPAGKHEFVLWHEAKGTMRDVKVGGEKTDRKGRVKLTIKAGETLDLGEIKVAPAVLGK